MRFSLIVKALAALCFAAPALAFVRSTPDTSPLDNNFTYSGVPDISYMIAYNGTGDKSYWITNFLHCDNGHDYAIVTTSANANGYLISSLTFTDITAGTHFGVSYITEGQLSLEVVAADSGLIKVGAYTPDQVSQLFAMSTIPGAKFNLTYEPKGPSLYQGGQGEFLFGGTVVYAYDYPQCAVQGTLTLADGTTTNIIPAESFTWFDIQWGPGFAPAGWHNFVIILDNGIKALLETTVYDPAYLQCNLATLTYPDGHTEIYYMDPDVHPRNPWKSAYSNATFYQDYTISIPNKLTLDVHLPVQGGDYKNNYTTNFFIADSFANYNGVLDGLIVAGVGTMERGGPTTDSHEGTTALKRSRI